MFDTDITKILFINPIKLGFSELDYPEAMEVCSHTNDMFWNNFFEHRWFPSRNQTGWHCLLFDLIEMIKLVIKKK